MIEKSRKAVFAGLARNVAPFLPKVLRNIELLSGEFSEAFTILVENDSTDNTRSLLRAWVAGRQACLVEMDGLAERLPSRTERIAAARNRYLQEVGLRHLHDHDYLVMLDMDQPNSLEIDRQGFSSAIAMLEEDEGIAAVFANQVPVYYDVWALRHDALSPDDCWGRVREDQTSLGYREAVLKHVRARQIFIHPESDPIEVDSAFGGLAVYRMSDALRSTYTGSSGGTDCCEHVGFNRRIREAGKRLYILPSLLNVTSFDHTDFKHTHRPMSVCANGRCVNLIAMVDHKLDTYRSRHPLYDERFPMLSAVFSKQRKVSVIDVGANIGDGLALCRLHGCRSRYIAVEGCKEFFSLLYANAFINSALFGEFELVDKYIDIGRGNVRVAMVAGTASLVRSGDAPGATVGAGEFVTLEAVDDGTAALVKIDTDGNDARIILNNADFLNGRRPILWAEAEVVRAESLAEWNDALGLLPRIYEYVAVFDNFGFLIATGRVVDVAPTIRALLGYIHRHAVRDPALFGSPTIYYLDLAFFSADDVSVYNDFLARLNEHA